MSTKLSTRPIAAKPEIKTAAFPAATERVCCYLCGASDAAPFISAEEDLTGKPGTFHFVRCAGCDLVYQNPRVPLDGIGAYYDDDYIAHRRKNHWGWLAPFFERGMQKLDREKAAIVNEHITLDATSRVLDLGCGSGSFLAALASETGCAAEGVDFKDLSDLPAFARDGVELHVGLAYDLPLPEQRYDLITMWHFLEHDYHPRKSLQAARRLLKDDGVMVIEVPRLDSRSFRWFGDRWPGLQAPQHTVLFERATLEAALKQTGWRVEAYLPYGAFPAYFYLFAGLAFKLRRGKGIDLRKAILPYLLGQVLCAPLLWFERRLNLAMQTVVCRKEPS